MNNNRVSVERLNAPPRPEKYIKVESSIAAHLIENTEYRGDEAVLLFSRLILILCKY